MESSLDVAALLERHQREVWIYLRVLGCEANQADDLCQETFIEVLRRPFRDDNPRSTAAYLKKVAKHRFLMAVRANKARPAFNSLDGFDPAFNKQYGDRDAYIQALEECLTHLPERNRQVIKARFLNGQRAKAVAQALGIKEALVNTIVQRAKAQLKLCIKGKIKHD